MATNADLEPHPRESSSLDDFVALAKEALVEPAESEINGFISALPRTIKNPPAVSSAFRYR